MPQLNDLSRSLVALDQDSTIIDVVELSQSSWLVAGVLPGIERQPQDGFGDDVDYAQLIKVYGEIPHPAGRYSPAQIQGTKTFCCTGNPDPKHVSTSYVERQ